MIGCGNLGDLTYTDNHGLNTGARSPICQIPLKDGCACRHHMRYTRGIKLKGDQRERLSELQVDRIALQRDIPKHQIAEKDASEELKEYNRGQVWETRRQMGNRPIGRRNRLGKTTLVGV